MSARAHIVGRIVEDLKLTPIIGGKNGKDHVSNFSLSCRDGHQIEYVEVTAWGDVAQNIMANTSKGCLIEIVGRIKTSEWFDKTTKLKQKKTYILVDWYEFLDRKPAIQEKLNV